MAKKIKVHTQPKLKPPRHDLRKIQTPKPKSNGGRAKMFKLKKKRSTFEGVEISDPANDPNYKFFEDLEVGDVVVISPPGDYATYTAGVIVQKNPKSHTAWIRAFNGVIMYVHETEIFDAGKYTNYM